MRKDSVAFFLPTRKGSERVKNKNTRPFAGQEGGLVENKLRQVLASKLVDEILFSSNDESCIAVAEKYTNENRLRIIQRPESLCLSSTNLQDLIAYVPTITDARHILWGHVTTPFVDGEVYDNAIARYLKECMNGFDSLVGVKELKNFLLNGSGEIINNTTDILWPRTQDLEPIYEVNHTIFLADRAVYLTDKNRLGKRPFLYMMDGIKGFDIDWPDDFAIAEALFKTMEVSK